jgi:CRP-like cAMP-binding protein
LLSFSNVAYTLSSGTVTVKQKWGADSVVLAQLQVGDIFGEQSILHDERRNATVTVDPGGDLVLLSLNRAAFQTLFREDRLNVIFADRARQAVTTGEEQRGAPGEGEGVIEEAVRARLATPGGGGPVEGDVKMLVLTAINTSVLFRGLDRDFKEAVASVMCV